MNQRILAFLVGFLGFVVTGIAQPTFHVEKDITANPGDSIEVDITADDFVGIVGGQFSMNYDSLVLEYRRLKNLNSIFTPPFVIGPPQITKGDLRFNWFDPALAPQTLPNGSLLYTLVFDVVGEECDSSAIEFSDMPIPIEILNEDNEDIGLIQDNAVFEIPGQNCMGGGGGDDLEIIASMEVGDQGSTACVSFTVNNFETIDAFQFSLNFNNTVITNAVPQNFNLQFLNASSFNVNNNTGVVTVAWFDNNTTGITVPDGTQLFELCFDIIGSSGQSSGVNFSDTPIQIEFTTPTEEVPVVTTNGRVTVSGGGGGGDELIITATNESGPNGSRVCSEVSVEGFMDIIGFQFSMNFNNGVINNGSVENFNLSGLNAGNFNINNNSGVITAVWTDPNGAGVTIPDGTVIFELCFDVVGSSGQSSPLAFTNNPLEINFFTLDEDKDVTANDGRVTVSGGMGGSDLEIEVIDTTLRMGDPGFTRFAVRNFEEVDAFQFTIMYDTDAIDNWSVSDFGLPGFRVGNFNEISPGMIRVFWADELGEPRTLADGSTLFRFNFTPVGDCDTETDIKVVDDLPTFPVEFAGPMGTIPHLAIDGTITISCMTANPITINAINNMPPSCNGVCDGVINITPGGGDGMNYAFSWTRNGQPIAGNTGMLTGLCAGTYNVTITSGGVTGTFGYILTDPPAINITDVEVTDETEDCEDGAIEVMGSGGTGNIRYIWSNGENTARIENLAAGTYVVTVLDDNDCFQTKTYNLDGPGVLALTGDDVMNLTCNEDIAACDGAITLMTSGGCMPITFSWEGPNGETYSGDNITGLCAGSYTVTIEDGKGSQITRTYMVRQPTIIEVINVTITPSNNNDGSIDPIIRGGTPIGDYQYEWTDANGNVVSTDRVLTNAAPGEYTLCITDGVGCRICETLTVPSGQISISVMVDVLSGGNNVSCAGDCDGSATINIAGGTAPYTVSWSDGGTGEMRTDLCAETYIITVTDDTGASLMDTIELTEPDELEVDIVELSCVTEEGEDGNYEVDITGGTGPYSVTWCNGATGPIATNLDAGNCNVLVVDVNGCQVFEEFEVCSESAPDDDGCYEAMPIITPNGDNANEFFVITCIDQYPNQLEVFDRFGQLIYEQRNYDNSWNGLDTNGTEVTEGGYLWVLRVDLPNGGQRFYKGVVNLLR